MDKDFGIHKQGFSHTTVRKGIGKLGLIQPMGREERSYRVWNLFAENVFLHLVGVVEGRGVISLSVGGNFKLCGRMLGEKIYGHQMLNMFTA